MSLRRLQRQQQQQRPHPPATQGEEEQGEAHRLTHLALGCPATMMRCAPAAAACGEEGGATQHAHPHAQLDALMHANLAHTRTHARRMTWTAWEVEAPARESGAAASSSSGRACVRVCPRPDACESPASLSHPRLPTTPPHSALQGLLRKLGAGFDDMMGMGMGMGGGGRFKVGGWGQARAGPCAHRGAALQALQARSATHTDRHRPCCTPTQPMQAILSSLRQADDEVAQLGALTELCEVLSISSEDTLAAFPVESAVPMLVGRQEGTGEGRAQRCPHHPMRTRPPTLVPVLLPPPHLPSPSLAFPASQPPQPQPFPPRPR